MGKHFAKRILSVDLIQKRQQVSYRLGKRHSFSCQMCKSAVKLKKVAQSQAQLLRNAKNRCGTRRTSAKRPPTRS